MPARALGKRTEASNSATTSTRAIVVVLIVGLVGLTLIGSAVPAASPRPPTGPPRSPRNITGPAEAAVQTSSGVEDTRRATDALARMSESLQELVGQFKV